eukprot:5685142-Pleurochrysis_carterae.AAC.2
MCQPNGRCHPPTAPPTTPSIAPPAASARRVFRAQHPQPARCRVAARRRFQLSMYLVVVSIQKIVQCGQSLALVEKCAATREWTTDKALDFGTALLFVALCEARGAPTHAHLVRTSALCMNGHEADTSVTPRRRRFSAWCGALGSSFCHVRSSFSHFSL